MPSLMVMASMAFAVVLIEADSTGYDRWLGQWPRLFGVGAENAHQMLSTLAGSMMTVMGITFSMTLLALVLASGQYTSRILRNFMRSRVTQETLRVIAIVPTFEDLLAEAFDQIRDNATGNVAIMAHMFGSIDTIASRTVSPSHLRALDEQLQWIAELADRSIEANHDRERLARRLTDVREALNAEPAVR